MTRLEYLTSNPPIHDRPIIQGPVKKCCVCDKDTRKHIKQRITGSFGDTVVNNYIFFCQTCGRELTTKDMDLINEETHL